MTRTPLKLIELTFSLKEGYISPRKMSLIEQLSYFPKKIYVSFPKRTVKHTYIWISFLRENMKLVFITVTGSFLRRIFIFLKHPWEKIIIFVKQKYSDFFGKLFISIFLLYKKLLCITLEYSPKELREFSSMAAKLLLCIVKWRISKARKRNPWSFGKLLWRNFK